MRYEEAYYILTIMTLAWWSRWRHPKCDMRKLIRFDNYDSRPVISWLFNSLALLGYGAL